MLATPQVESEVVPVNPEQPTVNNRKNARNEIPMHQKDQEMFSFCIVEWNAIISRTN